MKSKSIVAALITTMGLSTGLATVVAIPANADPQDEQIDATFVKIVREKGLRMKSDKFAIDLGHSTCGVLARGGSTEDALRHVQNATDWKDVKDVGLFGGLAVQAYCPGALAK